jgi:TatA/E family protein of Tat protein translocase
MLAMLSDTGILVLVIAVVLLFGTSQIPKLARNVAEAGKEFRKAHADAEQDLVPAPASLPPASSSVQTQSIQNATEGGTVTLTRSELDALLASGRVQDSGQA